MNKVIHSAGVMLEQAKRDADKARVTHESAEAATTRARLKFEQAQGTLSSARDDLLDAASRSRPDRANTRLKALAVEVAEAQAAVREAGHAVHRARENAPATHALLNEAESRYRSAQIQLETIVLREIKRDPS